jgi:hypothetical protein
MIDFTGAESCIALSMQNGLCSETERRTTYRIGGGGEYIVAGRMPLRLGYLFDSSYNAHHVSGGVGYLDPERGFGLDLSLRQQVSAGTQTVALLGIRILRQ